MLHTIYLSIQLVVSVILIMAILLQHKGAGLGAGFGGGGAIISTKRGVDLFLHKATIVLSILFFGMAFVNVFI